MTAYPVLQGLFCSGITRRLGRFMVLTSVNGVSAASAHVAADSSEPGRFPTRFTIVMQVAHGQRRRPQRHRSQVPAIAPARRPA